MVPLDYVLAVVAVTAPGAIVGDHAHLGPALRRLAVCWELIDPRERRCLRKRSSFAEDLRWLRRRHGGLRRAPHAGEVCRLPPLPVVLEGLEFNRAFRETLARRAELADAGPAREEALRHLKEVDRRHRIWDLMRDAHSSTLLVTARREALAALRQEVGEEAFFRAEWPAVVPLEAFRER